jgi:glycosyltransferase involved in cell wall biosynthesis
MMNCAPQVSVIIPALRRKAWLDQAVNSILDQTFHDYEIIIVKGASNDITCNVTRDRLRCHCARTRTITVKQSGLASARNRGMAISRGRYYAFLDSDNVWTPDHLDRVMNAFEIDPDLGLVHSNVEHIASDGRPRGACLRHWDKCDDVFEALALRLEQVVCSTAVVSQEAIEAVGRFDERFDSLGGEDIDLWLRIAERFRVRYIDHVGARHYLSNDGSCAEPDRIRQAHSLLISKVGGSCRGRELVAAMEAMTGSDLGCQLLLRGDHIAALRQRWFAARLDPAARLLWERLMRACATACLRDVEPAQGANDRRAFR